MEPLHFPFSSVTQANVAITPEDHMWAFFVSSVDFQETSHEVKLSADFGDGWNVEGIGVHIVEDIIPCMTSDNNSESPGGRETGQRRFHDIEAGCSNAVP